MFSSDNISAVRLFGVLFVIISLARLFYVPFMGSFLTCMFNIKKPSHQKKVGESMWFFTFYFCTWQLLRLSLRDVIKPHSLMLFDRQGIWASYPSQREFLSTFVLMLELSYYASSFVFLFFETRKNHSDFWMMMLHHVATCILIGGGYYYRYEKLICVPLFFHDCADILLEGAKVLNYTGFSTLRLIPFALLVPVWGIPRLALFPYYIVSQSARVWLHQREQFPMMGVFLAFQVAIYIMDGVWFFLIVRMVVRGVLERHVEKDCRSESEAEESSVTESDESSSVVSVSPTSATSTVPFISSAPAVADQWAKGVEQQLAAAALTARP